MPLLYTRQMICWSAFCTTLIMVSDHARGDCTIKVTKAELIKACHTDHCDNNINVKFRTPWPANDGQQNAVGELVLPLTGIRSNFSSGKPDDAPITVDEWRTLVAQLPKLSYYNNTITFFDSINPIVIAENIVFDLNKLLETGRSEARWERITSLGTSAARTRSLGSGTHLYIGKTIHVSDAALCQKLDYWPANHTRGVLYTNGDLLGHIRHSLNTTSDQFTAPLNGSLTYVYERHLFVRAQPTNLNFGTNPTGKTMKRDISIGVSTSSTAQVRYTFSYTSITKTREDVLIDGRSLPAQFTVSVPASNITSFTDFKHQVSLTSPDAGKVDGYIRVVAEML
ncbi:hypothetical protein EHN25_05510 [Salmonella enterica]|nr:hypothetical protein [Salmonella enterica]